MDKGPRKGERQRRGFYGMKGLIIIVHGIQNSNNNNAEGRKVHELLMHKALASHHYGPGLIPG